MFIRLKNCLLCFSRLISNKSVFFSVLLEYERGDNGIEKVEISKKDFS